jgi:ribosome maturation factor RimP
MLEVQSPGMDRELKTDREFRVFVGRRVQVQTRQPVEDLGDTFIGTLGGVNDNVLTVTNAKPQQQKKKETPIVREEVTVDLSKCTHVRLYSELLEKSSDRKAETHN